MSPVSRRIPTRALLRATGVLAACLALAAAPAAPAAAAAAAVAEDHAQPIEIGAARVTGQLVDSFGLLTLVPAADSDVHLRRGHGRRIQPRWVLTGSVGPANQGLIVHVVGTITQPVEPDPPFGSKIFVDDGSGPIRVFVNTSSGIDVSGLAQGQTLSVTGFSSAFNDPEIDPRFQSDLRQPERN